MRQPASRMSLDMCPLPAHEYIKSHPQNIHLDKTKTRPGQTRPDQARRDHQAHIHFCFGCLSVAASNFILLIPIAHRHCPCPQQKPLLEPDRLTYACQLGRTHTSLARCRSRFLLLHTPRSTTLLEHRFFRLIAASRSHGYLHF